MKNIIGKNKTHVKGYEYLSIFPFPSNEIKEVIPNVLIQKSNYAQFLLGKLSGITVLLPDVDYFISSYVMKDATSSSQIEGTKATMIDAFEYVADPKNKENTDADDISHYVSALKYGLGRLKEDDFPFSLRFIRELHKELMHGARSTHFADPGEFRNTQNWIGGKGPEDASFVPPAPEDLHIPLRDLEKFIHTPYIHPIIDAGLLHAQFETIHPFLDGNGRTGRLLITFYFIHYKYLELPALFLSSYFKRHQKVYYQRLNEYHAGDIIPWIDFFVDAVVDTAQEAIEISKQVTKLRDNDLAAISRFSKKTSDIAVVVVQKLYKNPIVSSTTIQEWVGQTKPGTFKFIDKLVEAGILVLHRKSEGIRPSLYAHKAYLKIFEDK
ncbi:MAG: Fic family protein [Candidatus Magasanikbacteria bacterium]|jgi:Fic family protein|nr:Fic family protein [Candidatus Magasanikbacteria bacterium]